MVALTVVLGLAGLSWAARAQPAGIPQLNWVLFIDGNDANLARYDPATGRTTIASTLARPGARPVGVAADVLLWEEIPSSPFASRDRFLWQIDATGQPLGPEIALGSSTLEAAAITFDQAAECLPVPEDARTYTVLSAELGFSYQTIPVPRRLEIERFDATGASMGTATLGYWEAARIEDFTSIGGGFYGLVYQGYDKLSIALPGASPSYFYIPSKATSIAWMDEPSAGTYRVLRIDRYTGDDGYQSCQDGFVPSAFCPAGPSGYVDELPGSGLRGRKLLRAFDQGGFPKTYFLWSEPSGTARVLKILPHQGRLELPLIDLRSVGEAMSMSGVQTYDCPIPNPDYDPFVDRFNPLPSEP